MIKSIEFDNYYSNETLKIDLRTPETSGFWVKSIKGIGPGKATINTTDMASFDGGVFNSARSEIRNITITLGIIGIPQKKSVEEVRRDSYRFFGKKKPIRFIINTDLVSLYTDGYIESAEPDIFNKQETIAISIICPDPNLYNMAGEHNISFSATESAFEFPLVYTESSDSSFLPGKFYYEKEGEDYFLTADQEMVQSKTYYEGGYSNEVDDEYFVTEDTEFKPGKEYFEQEVIDGTTYYTSTADARMVEGKTYYEYQNNTIFANILDIAKQDISYDGEIEVGVIINAYISDQVSGFHIYKLYEEYNTYEEIAFDDAAIISSTGAGISPGDSITVCTIPGKKYAILRRGTDVFNIMNSLGTNPDWFILNQGLNTFTYSAEAGESFISLDIIYDPAYEGV